MKPVVLDGSTTLSLLLTDERSRYTERALIAVESGRTLLVPLLWWLETLNGLVMAERRRRISQVELTEIVQKLTKMPVTTDAETMSRAVEVTLPLAREHGLTIYDAAYLELAIRRNAVLATVDRALLKAAGEAGVELLA
jgi:predicted nucleic acid-binding protein